MLFRSSFFIESIQIIRATCGAILPVTVFTDADNHEIDELLALPDVRINSAKADILDMLLLSRSKVCLLSISSTFSFWGGFLSDGIVLKHPDEWHPPLRPNMNNKFSYEGKFDPKLPLNQSLIEHLKKINIESKN